MGRLYSVTIQDPRMVKNFNRGQEFLEATRKICYSNKFVTQMLSLKCSKKSANTKCDELLLKVTGYKPSSHLKSVSFHMITRRPQCL